MRERMQHKDCVLRGTGFGRRIGSRTLMGLVVLIATSATALAFQSGDGYFEAFHSPVNSVGIPPGRTEPGGRTSPAAVIGTETPGSSNYTFTVPVANLKGRGLDVDLSLVYNSRIWSKFSLPFACDRRFTFNVDNGWPAPGFRLGFGKIIFFRKLDQFGQPYTDRNEFTLISPNGTRHHLEALVPINQTGDNDYVSTDGVFIRFRGGPTGGTAVFDNGTQVIYGAANHSEPLATWNGDAASASSSFPIKITDRNGNFTLITYTNPLDPSLPDSGPMISTVQDTLGRQIHFYYNSAGRLVTITVPASNGISERQVIRFYYSQVNITHPVVGGTVPWVGPAWVMTHVYFPGTTAGWRFDYTPHGMIFRLSRLHGMSVSTLATNQTGVVDSDGSVVATTEYNYPLSTNPLSDVPTYTRRTDDWAGRTAGMNGTMEPPFYTFSNDEAAGLSIVSAPDGTVTETRSIAYAECQARFPTGLKSDEGLVKEISVKKNGLTIRQIKTEWEHDGNWRNWRKKSEEVIDDVGNSRKTTFTYTSYNNISVARDFGFDGTEIRRTETSFETRPEWTNRNLIRLATSVKIFSGGSSVPLSRVDSAYDGNALLPYSNLTMHDSTVGIYRGNVTSVTGYTDPVNGSGPITESGSYDVVGNSISVTDPAGNTWQTEFSSTYRHAFATRITTPVPDPTGVRGASTSLQSDIAYNLWTGQVSVATEPNGQAVSYEYNDPIDRLTKENRPDGGWTSYEYNDTPIFRSVRTRVFEDSTRTSDAYHYFNGMGQRVRSFAFEGSISAMPWIVTDSYYDAQGRIERVSNPYRANVTSGIVPAQCNNCTSKIYDALGRVVEVTGADGARSRFSFDGTRVLATDPAGKQRISETNALGQLTHVWEIAPQDSEHPGTSPVSFPGHAEVTSGYHTAYVYDAIGNLRKVEQGIQRRYFAYDSLSRIVRVSNAEQGSSAVLALPANLVSPLSDNNNTWSLAFEYAPNGNLSSRTDARGVKTTFIHDALNRLQKSQYSLTAGTPPNYVTTPDVDYFYDGTGMPVYNGSVLPTPQHSKGKLTAIKSSVSESIYSEFDVMGRVKTYRQITSGATQPYIMKYTYNNVGQIMTEQYPSGRVLQTDHDSAGRVASLRNQGSTTYLAGGPINQSESYIQYTPHGAVTAMKLGNGLWEHAIFDPQRLQVMQIGLGTSAVDSSKAQFDYTYKTPGQNDNNGDVLTQTIALPGLASMTQIYSYDGLNRLKSAQEVVGGVRQWIQSFDYDRYGNRSIDTDNDQSGQPKTTAALVGPNPLISDITNRILRRAGTSEQYDYDGAGNVIADQAGNSFSYDAENHQVTYATNSGQTLATYFYDGDGRRVKRVSGDAMLIFVYNVLGQMIAEYDSVAPSESSGVLYITSDVLRSTRVISDSAGNVLKRNDYLPFGEDLVSYSGRSSVFAYGGNERLRQRFTQYERDSETNLDFAQARYYASMHGRFTSPDPMQSSANPSDPQSWNRFTYGLNNPLKYIDPFGLGGFLGGEPDYTWITDGNGNYRPLDEEQWQRFLDSDEVLTWYPVPSGTNIGHLTYVEGTERFKDSNAGLVGSTVTLGADGNFQPVTDSLYAEELNDRMEPYVPPLIASMEYMWMIMSFFTVPVPTGGPMSTLALEAGTATTASRLSGTALARQLGTQGENAVRKAHDIGSKTAISIGDKTRVPDGLTLDLLSEVKNVRSLSYTKQLRDYAWFANHTGRRFDLYVRPGAKLSGPLRQARDEGLINILDIPF